MFSLSRYVLILTRENAFLDLAWCTWRTRLWIILAVCWVLCTWKWRTCALARFMHDIFVNISRVSFISLQVYPLVRDHNKIEVWTALDKGKIWRGWHFPSPNTKRYLYLPLCRNLYMTGYPWTFLMHFRLFGKTHRHHGRFSLECRYSVGGRTPIAKLSMIELFFFFFFRWRRKSTVGGCVFGKECLELFCRNFTWCHPLLYLFWFISWTKLSNRNKQMQESMNRNLIYYTLDCIFLSHNIWTFNNW